MLGVTWLRRWIAGECLGGNKACWFGGSSRIKYRTVGNSSKQTRYKLLVRLWIRGRVLCGCGCNSPPASSREVHLGLSRFVSSYAHPRLDTETHEFYSRSTDRGLFSSADSMTRFSVSLMRAGSLPLCLSAKMTGQTGTTSTPCQSVGRSETRLEYVALRSSLDCLSTMTECHRRI